MPTREELTWKHIEENKTLRTVRKQAKRNRKPDDTRRLDWNFDSDNLNAFYDLDVSAEERVMPRGERERRRTLLTSALTQQREPEPPVEEAPTARSVPGSEPAGAPAGRPGTHELEGTVVEVSTGLCRVEAPGRSLLCSLRGSLTAAETGFTNAVAVGDEVIVSANGSDQGVVEAVLPRRSLLTRPDIYYSHLQQAIAANEEVDRILGDRLPTFDDLPRLPYTRQIMSEAMRLYPPAWVVGRMALVDYPVGDYVVPAGAGILASQWVMHHDPRYYPDPYRFDPERWTPEAEASRPKFSYFPFGGGPRMCIGEQFAWTEGILMLATLARRWQLRLVAERPVELRPLITLRPRDGVPMTLQRRADAVTMPRAEIKQDPKELSRHQ